MTNRKTLVAAAAAVATAVTTFALPASAQKAERFGSKGQVILGADRLSPLLSYSSTSTTVNQPLPGGATFEATTTVKTTSSAILWGGSPSVIYNIPRFALDVAVIDHLTLGGAIWGYFTFGSSTESPGNNGVTVSVDNPKTTIFGVYPRIGYVLNFTDVFAFWPRGGFSITDVHTTNEPNGRNTVTTTDTPFALHLEPLFAITPIEHVGFTLGPVVDIPLFGAHSVTTTQPNGVSTSTDGSFKPFQFGIMAGLLAYL